MNLMTNAKSFDTNSGNQRKSFIAMYNL